MINTTCYRNVTVFELRSLLKSQTLTVANYNSEIGIPVILCDKKDNRFLIRSPKVTATNLAHLVSITHPLKLATILGMTEEKTLIILHVLTSYFSSKLGRSSVPNASHYLLKLNNSIEELSSSHL